MAGVVTTSLVVQFGLGTDEDNNFLSAEIDSRPEGYNGGNTSFLAGDSPVFLVYRSEGLTLSFVSSKGSIAYVGTGQIEVDEYITLANEKTGSLPKPPLGPVTMTHFGGTVGATIVGLEVVLPAVGTAVYRVQYSASFLAYRMSGIPAIFNGETTFPVVVVVTGTAA